MPVNNPFNLTFNGNITQWDSTNLGAPSNFGTSPGAVAVIGVNAALAIGTTMVSSTAGVPVIFTDNTNEVGVMANYGTSPGAVKALGVNAFITNSPTVVFPATPTVYITGHAGATIDAVTGAATAPTNGLATLVEYVSTIPALTTGQSIANMADTVGSSYVNTEGRKKTYSSYVSGTGVSGVNVSIPGNATTVLRITRVEVSISTSGTAGVITASLIKTSAAPTGGTSANMTVVPHDSGFAGADSTPLSWFGGVPTTGTPVGTIRGLQMFDESATIPGSNTWLWDWGMRPASAVVLRGTAQTLEINLSGVVSTQTLTVSIEWTEE